MPARNKVEVVITGANEAGPALKSVEKGLAGVGSQAERTSGLLAGFGRGLGSMVTGLGQLGMGVFGIQQLAQGVGGLATSLISGNSEMEETAALFQAFYKDSGKVAEVMAQVRKEADTTPFAFQEVARAAAGLGPAAKQANIPMMDLLKTAEILAASNPEQGLEGAAFALREAVSGDFTSVVERFNLPRQRLNELKAQGVPAVQAVSMAMKEMGYDADLISAKAKTLTGRWSTFADTLNGIKNRITAPLFDALKDGLTALQQLFDDNKATVDAWADTLAAGLKSVINWVKEAGTNVRRFLEYLHPANRVDVMREWFGGDLGPKIDQFVRLIKSIPESIRGILDDVNDLWVEFGMVFREEGLGAAIQYIAGLGGELAQSLYGLFAGAVGSVDWAGIWSRATAIGTGLLASGLQIAGNVRDWLAAQFAAVSWPDVWARVVGVATGIGGKAWDIVTQLTGWLGAQFASINWASVWGAVVGVANGLITALGDIWEGVSTWASEQWNRVNWAAVWAAAERLGRDLAEQGPKIERDVQSWAERQWRAVDWGLVWNQGMASAKNIDEQTAAALSGVSWVKVGKTVGDAMVDAVLGVWQAEWALLAAGGTSTGGQQVLPLQTVQALTNAFHDFGVGLGLALIEGVTVKLPDLAIRLFNGLLDILKNLKVTWGAFTISGAGLQVNWGTMPAPTSYPGYNPIPSPPTGTSLPDRSQGFAGPASADAIGAAVARYLTGATLTIDDRRRGVLGASRSMGVS